MNETLINLLQQNRAEKARGEEEKRRYHEVCWPRRKASGRPTERSITEMQ